MAGTVIDKLVVSIGLDNSGFTKGLKKVDEDLHNVSKGTEKTGRQLEDVGKKGADSFASFRREAAGALALFTGGAGIIKFTGDIAAANTALGALSRQLDITPQKLTQLRSAMAATGGNAADIDSAFKSVQLKASSQEGLSVLRRLGQLTGVNYIDANGNVRSDIFDQMAHSKQWRGLTRGVQENYAQQLGFSSSVVNFTDRNDYDALKKQFAGLGPTAQQIRQAEQLNADWEALKANTDQVMQRVFSDLEPSIHNFSQALIALEKSHPKEIADGVAGVAAALSVLSAMLTAKSFVRALGFVSGIGNISGAVGTAGRLASGVGGAVTAGIAEAVAHDVKTTGKSPWADTGTSEYFSNGDKKEGPTKAELENHYIQRTGSLTSLGIDWDKEGAIWQKETPEDRQKLENADDKRRWGWIHNSLEWLKNSVIPASHADDAAQAPGGIDLDRLTGAVAMQESGGNPNAVSPAGAQGLLQIMPETANSLGVTNPLDPDQSWNAGRQELSQLISKYHDRMKALAAYNWGSGNLDNDLKSHGDNWQSYLPKETLDYLDKVSQNYQSGNVIHHNNTTHSPTITVNVNGGSGSPDDIRRMAQKGVASALDRHDAGKVG